MESKRSRTDHLEAWEPHARSIVDCFEGDLDAVLIVESSLGEREELPVRAWFRRAEQFDALDRDALVRCRGKVLDVGAGAGPHSLVLQERGYDVTALEHLPDVCAVLRRRGVRDVRCASLHAFRGARFDTLLVLGSGAGLAETIGGLPRLFDSFERLLAPGGQVLIDSTELPDSPGSPAPRYKGDLEFRLEYKGLRAPSFRQLYVDPLVFACSAAGAGFHLDVVARYERGSYLARLSRASEPAPRPRTLVLFDIDGTLLGARGAGYLAVRDAFRELFGREPADGAGALGGRLDPEIWRATCAASEVADPDAHAARFRAAYARHLAGYLRESGRCELKPGARELVEALGARDEVALGLLTGNWPETGRAKIAAAGLDPERFLVCAWGSDGERRRDLPAVARRRYQERFGQVIEPLRMVVVGDTPHDVDCARFHACRSLAVATGPHGVGELRAAGATLAVEDLSDTRGLARWMAEGGPALA